MAQWGPLIVENPMLARGHSAVKEEAPITVNRDQTGGITESWAGLQWNPLGADQFRFHWLGFLQRFEIEIVVLVGVQAGAI